MERKMIQDRTSRAAEASRYAQAKCLAQEEKGGGGLSKYLGGKSCSKSDSAA